MDVERYRHRLGRRPTGRRGNRLERDQESRVASVGPGISMPPHMGPRGRESCSSQIWPSTKCRCALQMTMYSPRRPLGRQEPEALDCRRWARLADGPSMPGCLVLRSRLVQGHMGTGTYNQGLALAVQQQA